MISPGARAARRRRSGSTSSSRGWRRSATPGRRGRRRESMVAWFETVGRRDGERDRRAGSTRCAKPSASTCTRCSTSSRCTPMPPVIDRRDRDPVRRLDDHERHVDGARSATPTAPTPAQSYIVKPAVGAAMLAMLALGDERLFQRMLALIVPAQRPGAIMFGDLESSTALARRLPSSVYFTLIRRLSLAIDEVVVDHGGDRRQARRRRRHRLLPQRGRTAPTAAAARACIEAAREIQARTAGDRRADRARARRRDRPLRAALGSEPLRRPAADERAARGDRARRRGQRGRPDRAAAPPAACGSPRSR